jgi:hypothetical protein
VIEMTDARGLRGAVTGRRSRTGCGEFADLVCTEPGWLDTEFEAIIAANFGVRAFDPDIPMPLPPHRDVPAASRPGRREPAWPGPVPAHTRMARRVGACERSPPFDTSCDRQ